MLERIQNVLRNRKENGSDKGFSLVELAVVIVIIGILVAIAVPVFANMQDSAKTATNKANAANGASMIAAAVAASSGGSIDIAVANTELGKLKDNGVSVGATLSAPTGSTAVTLSNFCVTVAPSGSGAAGKSGPACTS